MCGSDLAFAVEFCLGQQAGEAPKLTREAASGEEVALHMLVDMGFDKVTSAAVLQQTASDLPQALGQLLRGPAERAPGRQVERRLATTVLPAPCAAPAQREAFEQYTRRAPEYSERYSPGQVFAVCDLGLMANRRTNACFWLSIVAACSRCKGIKDDPQFFGNVPLLAAHRATLDMVADDAVHALQRSARPQRGMDGVGMLADRLRQVFCAERYGPPASASRNAKVASSFRSLDTRGQKGHRPRLQSMVVASSCDQVRRRDHHGCSSIAPQTLDSGGALHTRHSLGRVAHHGVPTSGREGPTWHR